jgi:RNA polymerase sigma-70 factor (ECF subfamily)
MGSTEPGDDEAAIAASRTAPARFAEVFERRLPEIYRYVAHRAGTGPAEELTAETFVRAFASRHTYDPLRGPVPAWLYGIATNVIGLHQRSEGRRRRAYERKIGLQASEGAGATVEDSTVARVSLRSALSHLDPDEQDVIYLIAGLGLTYEETSVWLGVPIGTVRSRYARARRRMAQRLGTTHSPSDRGRLSWRTK